MSAPPGAAADPDPLVWECSTAWRVVPVIWVAVVTVATPFVLRQALGDSPHSRDVAFAVIWLAALVWEYAVVGFRTVVRVEMDARGNLRFHARARLAGACHISEIPGRETAGWLRRGIHVGFRGGGVMLSHGLRNLLDFVRRVRDANPDVWPPPS